MKNYETMSFEIDKLKKKPSCLEIIKDKGFSNTDDMLLEVYKAFLDINHQNPIENIVEYFMSGDPIYITRNRGARYLISNVDRFELLAHIIESHLKILEENEKM